MDASTIGGLALVIFVFGLGPLGWLILPVVAIFILLSLLAGEIITSTGFLKKDDDNYNDGLLPNSEQAVIDSLTAEMPHTEGH